MGRRTVLPPPLDDGAFLMADAQAAGISARLTWLHRPFHGVRCHGPCDSIAECAAALQPALPPESAFCAATAAGLLELPLPARLEAGEVPVQVMTPTARPVIRHRGTRGHRGLESRTVKQVAGGLRVTGPVDTWLDLAPVLALDELVVLGDAILARNADLLDDLVAGVKERAGTRGVRRARDAVRLLRSGVRSPMETVTRLLLLRAGLPEPEVNAQVTDSHHTWLAEADLVWREQKVIVEYDGVWHRDPGQRRLDAARRRQLRAEGWIVIELFVDDVMRRPERTVWIVREALEGRIAA